MLRIAITLIALFVYISVFSQDSVPHQPKAERSNSAVQPHSQKDSLLNLLKIGIDNNTSRM